MREDAIELDCLAEVEHIRTLVAEGNSADRQIAAYRAAIDDGASEEDALRAVVDHLIEDTLVGLD